jgi:hypothetical protein
MPQELEIEDLTPPEVDAGIAACAVLLHTELYKAMPDGLPTLLGEYHLKLLTEQLRRKKKTVLDTNPSMAAKAIGPPPADPTRSHP